jgi:DNA-binding NarL/FixJ family response regulator
MQAAGGRFAAEAAAGGGTRVVLAAAGNQARELLAEPFVVLMDLNLPGMSGIECTRRLKLLRPAMQIVMLTSFESNDAIFESLAAGATGYVLKRAPGPQIVEAVRDVHNGGSPMSPAIARKVVAFFAKRVDPLPSPRLDRLSDRERAVLEALAEGQQYKEIADTLGISINTVRNHVKRIYEKLQVNTRLDAVKKLGRV